jgi:alkylation response protein AidB-like acyl-CoA dehydrogenase
MGTVSRLPEKFRPIAPIIVSEAEAFDGAHTLIRYLSSANDGFSARRQSFSISPAIVGSGLLGITVPPEQGGADVSNIALGEIVLATAAADRVAAMSLASHFHSVELLRGASATGPCDFFYSRALAGDLFLMAGTIDDVTDVGGLRLAREASKPGLRLNGTVQTTIDPIHADWIVIHAAGETGEHAVFIPRMTAGLRLTPEQISFSNVHVDADCFVPLADCTIATAGPLDNLLRAAQRLGWAERTLNDKLAQHARPSMRQRRTVGTEYLSALGLTVSRLESGKAALERAGGRLDTAQVNGDADTVQKATFSSAIALSSAAEAFDLASEIGTDHHAAWDSMDPYGHAPIGARLLENSIH